MTRSPAALLLPLLLLPSACGGTARETEPTTGVRGVVLSGPQCPVVTVESPCPDLPVADLTVRATTPAGELAASAVTDGDGRFEVPLPPGDYTLHPVVEGGGPPFAKPQDVTVPSVGFVEVTLLVDTGIRAGADTAPNAGAGSG